MLKANLFLLYDKGICISKERNWGPVEVRYGFPAHNAWARSLKYWDSYNGRLRDREFSLEEAGLKAIQDNSIILKGAEIVDGISYYQEWKLTGFCP